MFDSNFTAVGYLLLVLMLVFLVVVTVLRNNFLSILRSVRHAKTEHSSVVGNAERNSSTVNDAGAATTQPDIQIYQRAQPTAKGEPANSVR